MSSFLLRLIAGMAGIWVASWLVSGITFTPGANLTATLLTLAGIAFIFTAVNSLVRPLVKVLAFPLYIITFGLFAFVNNALMFMLTGWLSQMFGLPFEVSGFWPALFGGFVTSIIASLVIAVIGDDSKKRR